MKLYNYWIDCANRREGKNIKTKPSELEIAEDRVIGLLTAFINNSEASTDLRIAIDKYISLCDNPSVVQRLVDFVSSLE